MNLYHFCIKNLVTQLQADHAVHTSKKGQKIYGEMPNMSQFIKNRLNLNQIIVNYTMTRPTTMCKNGQILVVPKTVSDYFFWPIW